MKEVCNSMLSLLPNVGMESQGHCSMGTIYANVGVHCGLLALKDIVKKRLRNKNYLTAHLNFFIEFL